MPLRNLSPGVYADDTGRTYAELDHRIDADGTTLRTLIEQGTHDLFLSWESPARPTSA